MNELSFCQGGLLNGTCRILWRAKTTCLPPLQKGRRHDKAKASAFRRKRRYFINIYRCCPFHLLLHNCLAVCRSSSSVCVLSSCISLSFLPHPSLRRACLGGIPYRHNMCQDIVDATSVGTLNQPTSDTILTVG